MTLSSDGLNITEPRNAAAGFAITMWMANVDAPGTHCSTRKGESVTQSASALESWKKRNSPCVDATPKYTGEIEDCIASDQGQEARQKFRDDHKTEFADATRRTEAVWFSHGTIDTRSCLNMASHAADESMDLDKSQGVFPRRCRKSRRIWTSPDKEAGLRTWHMLEPYALAI